MLLDVIDVDTGLARTVKKYDQGKFRGRVLREASGQVEQELAVKWPAYFAAKCLLMLPLRQRPLRLGRARNQKHAGHGNRRRETKQSRHGAASFHAIASLRQMLRKGTRSNGTKKPPGSHLDLLATHCHDGRAAQPPAHVAGTRDG